MKGVIFTSFLEMVEDKFGLELTERIVESADLASNGAYTAVGTYSHEEILELVTKLSEESQVALADLVEAFGKHLFGQLAAAYPNALAEVNGPLDLMETIENTIHVEVKKLYPDAELPTIDAKRVSPNELDLTYRSSRPFAILAGGLIMGCLEHFEKQAKIETEDLADGAGTAMKFRIALN